MNLDHTPQPDHAINLLPALSSAAPARRFSLGRLITFGFAWMFGLEPFLSEPSLFSKSGAESLRNGGPGSSLK